MTKLADVCAMCSNNLICINSPEQRVGGTFCGSCNSPMLRVSSTTDRTFFVRVPGACVRYKEEPQHYFNTNRAMSKYDWDYYVKGSRELAMGKYPVNTSFESILIIARQRFCMACAAIEAGRVHKELLKLCQKAR